MQKLFHYCNVEAFFNIIKYKKLWLSGAHNLNDYQEIHWTLQRIYDTLKKHETSFPLNDIEFLWQHIQLNKQKPYICSFSTEGDLLSQWRAYARDGTGVSIGFNSEYFPTGRLPGYGATPELCITTLPVIYSNVVQEKNIETILVNCLTKMEHEPEDQKGATVLDASYHLNGLSTIYKSEAFSEECEWRVIHTPMIMGHNVTNETSIYSSISEIKYRVSNDRLLTYFEFDFSNTSIKKPILDLVLGPKCNISDYDLRLFLSLNGFPEITPRRSVASYR